MGLGSIFFQESFYNAGASGYLDAHTATNLASPYSTNGGTWTGIDASDRAICEGLGVLLSRTYTSAGTYKTNGTPTNANYYVYSTLTIHDFNNYLLPGIRCSGTSTATNNGYYLTISSTTLQLYQCTNGAFVSIGSWTHGLTAPTTLPIAMLANGDVITVYADTGSGLASRISYNDATPIVGPGAPGARGSAGSGGVGDGLGVQMGTYYAQNYVTTGIASETLALLESASPTTVTFIGTGTTWQSVGAPTLTLSGGTGASVGSVTVTSDTQCSAPVIPGSATGALTITDSTTSAACNIYVCNVIASNSNVNYSPYNWLNVSGELVTINEGAYFNLPFTATSVQLGVDVSVFISNAISNANYPTIQWSIDDGIYTQRQLLATDVLIPLASGLVSENHVLHVYLQKVVTSVDRWNTPVNALRVFGFVIDAAASTYSLATKPNNSVLFGDSITAGIVITSPDALQCYVTMQAASRNSEYGQIGLSAQGWQWLGAGNVPMFWKPGDTSNQTPFLYWSGNSRLVASKFSPMPNYVYINMGTNDGHYNGGNPGLVVASVESFLPALRAALNSNVWIFLMVPFGQWSATPITTGFTAYQVATPDSYCKLVNLGTAASAGLVGTASQQSADGIHPNITTSGILSSLAEDIIYPILNPGSGSGNVVLVGSPIVRGSE